MREFEVEELKDYLASEPTSLLLLDVRQPGEYEICRLEPSILIPMRKIPSSIHQLDKEQETVVICHHGIRSRQVAFYLEQAGFSNIINLNGGLAAWAKIIDTTMATY